VTCDEARELLSPFADGELDLVRALEIERHLAECPACAAALEGLRALSARLADPALYHRPPAAVAARVRASLRPRRSFPWRRGGIAVAAALLAAVALWGAVRGLSAPSAEELIEREVVNAHIHSLIPGHLLDFPSDKQHKVKPWFDGRVDVAPDVKDLTDDHFPLEGARQDYIDGRPTAAVVYRRRDHVINVLVWREVGKDRPPVYLERQGYHLAHWANNERAFWVVSDLNAEELRQFVELLRR
jgi:anti-sigma factor RsiW